MNGTAATAERATVEERWTNVNGTVTRYLEAGSGEPVLLLPGEGGVSEQWSGVLRSLAGSHRAIAVDFPGYGYSEPVPDSSAPGLARFTWEFARSVGAERPAVIGHSLGGAIAVHMALRRPAQVAALVLANSAGMGRAINPLMVLQSVTPLGDLTRALVPVLPLAPQALVAALASAGACRPWRIPRAWWASQVKAASSPEALATTLRSQRHQTGLLGQRSLLGRLPELPMPTLVAWGVQDIVVPFWQAIAARRQLRCGQLRLMPCAGHLMPLEAAGAFGEAVVRFLSHAGSGAAEEGR